MPGTRQGPGLPLKYINLQSPEGRDMSRTAPTAEGTASAHRRLVRRAAIALACLGALGAAFLGGAYAYRERDAIVAWFSKSRTGVEVLQTSLYNIAVQKLPIPAEGRDGAIDALGDGILFVNRLGDSWFADENLQLRRLGIKVPVNYEEFVADSFNVDTTMRDRFAVKDILVQDVGSGRVRLLASFNQWRAAEDCYFLRVASLEATLDELLASSDAINSGWRTVFDTVPCRGLTPSPNGKNRMPTLGAGGRLVALADDQILLSVGGFGAETVSEESVAPPSGARSYGSTILINLATGESQNYSKGHRNPQGLATSPDGRIWMTDHGARGGDELNLVLQGRDYGHPSVSYGTEYESLVWRRNPHQGHHDGYEKPIYAWIPSIATSQLAVVTKPAFANWQDDLLVTSLKAQTMFRVKIDDGRAVLVEPIEIGHRIRDIAEAADGAVVLKTDDNLLVYLRPVDAKTIYQMDLPAETRGQVLASACMSCHSMAPDSPDGIGPNLWQVIGRPIASSAGYDYSDALSSVDGIWTEESLTAFIRDPQAFAPGSTMAATTKLEPRELEDLLAYLSMLR